MRVNAPSGILSPALIVMATLLCDIRLSTDRLGVQRPQLQDPRADVRNDLQIHESSFRLRDILELDLSQSEIDVRFVQMLDLPLQQTRRDGIHALLILAEAVIHLAELDAELTCRILGRLGIERGEALLIRLRPRLQ